MGVLETVPNVSEGRDAALIEALAEALNSADGVRLLDVSSDVDHHRTVFTAVGSPAQLEAALVVLCERALRSIDLRCQVGVHPRLGVVDVVPLVALVGEEREAARAAAESLARRLGDEVGLPVFLYGDVARRPLLRRPAGLRRLGLESIARDLAGGRLVPDFGPRRLDPRRGVCLVGARGRLVAFNVQLATDDVGIARSIARTIRESDGGLPGVQALGLALPSRGCVQVSTNLLDPFATSLSELVERITDEARHRGTDVLGSELVGLVPEEVVRAAARDAARLPRLDSRQVLESHLASPAACSDASSPSTRR